MKRFLVYITAALTMEGGVNACDTCNKKVLSAGPNAFYNLHVSEQWTSPAGRRVKGLMLNGSSPGPVLRFVEGDVARITVFNDLAHEEASMHWHGLLLPNEQDGVPHVTTPPIAPGGKHEFVFQLKHTGTYWYHSHTGLQEQRGVYGAIVVTPRGGERMKTDHDEVLQLSVWTNMHPYEVMRTLMRGSDWFGIRRGNAQSILGAAEEGKLKEYFSREWSRMPAMDVADVGYDTFLVNGRALAEIPGKPGETVRLRLINSAAATYYYIESSAGPLTIVAADGPAVKPVKVNRFLMAIAETYDVIVTIPASGRYELRATAMDGSGHVSAFFGSGVQHEAASPPKAALYDMEEMLNLALTDHEDDPWAALALPRPGSPYRVLESLNDTSLPADLPRHKISLHLTGDMSRYVWSLNGKTMATDPFIHIRKGEIVELELINDTMMHHPIHLHGHFFRLLMGQGKRSPLKHTVDVPPMGRRTIEFEANEEKDWMFHCHILYHMMAGMGRVFRYESNEPAMPGMGLGEHGHEMGTLFGQASVQTHMTEGFVTWMNPKNDVMLNWEAGWGNVEDMEYEADLMYQRYFNPNFQAFAGVRFKNMGEAEDRGVAGVNYRLPLMFQAMVSVDTEADVRLMLAKRIQLTPRLATWGRVEYDTLMDWEWTAGADFTLTRTLSLTAQYHSDFGWGGGLLIRF